jgi:DNA-binding NtrC family response regulator
MVGRGPAMLQVFDAIAVAAESDVPVFIVGETGTGKELVARAIHRAAGRLRGRSGSFVAVDLGAADHSLAESRLFGHREGAFTGAVGERRGAFALAEGGTIFLDEVANASPELQAKLLRVLQEREFLPLGGETRETTTARPLAATNQDPERLMKRGRLRADLWHRLAGHVIEIPPLRERMEDLEVLVPHLLRRAVVDADRVDVPTLAPDAWAALHRCPWPGNVRELENCLRVAVVSSPGPVILDTHLHVRAADEPPVASEDFDEDEAAPAGAHPRAPGPGGTPWSGHDGQFLTWDEGRAQHIEAALRRARGNVSAAAHLWAMVPTSGRSARSRIGVTAAAPGRLRPATARGCAAIVFFTDPLACLLRCTRV